MSFENVHEWNDHLEIFSRPQVIENSLGNICVSEQIFYRKQSLGAPDICAPPRSTNMAGSNANIWFQYHRKFDQLLTANEQIIPLNTFSNTFTIQRA